MCLFCLLKLFVNLIGLWRMGCWTWFIRAARDQALALTTLVRIVSETEYQTCTSPPPHPHPRQRRWGWVPNSLAFLTPSGITLGSLWEGLSRHLCFACTAQLCYKGFGVPEGSVEVSCQHLKHSCASTPPECSADSIENSCHFPALNLLQTDTQD